MKPFLKKREIRIAFKLAAIEMLLEIAQWEQDKFDIDYYTRRRNDLLLCLENEDAEIEPADVDHYGDVPCPLSQLTAQVAPTYRRMKDKVIEEREAEAANMESEEMLTFRLYDGIPY